MNPKVIGAIFKRNFISYFSSPTGYVFICVFVLLSSFAAFWPSEFFSANLANLNQLNTYLPYILLVFIPAITMSIWAEERRQGTDELLLTIPAADIDVVIGKYLAAVAIYTVSLVFSMISNLLVLATLGNPDIGLFLATYFGYWMVGLAMLAIGMVASFLTSNLTVAFILGAAFNAPLAFAGSADLLVADPARAASISRWSIAEQFRDFGRGVVSLDSVIYFLMIVVLMLYLCNVLIGRRHWLGSRAGRSLASHYMVRLVSLAAITGGATLLLADTRFRYDLTTERLSSLSPHTRRLLDNLEVERPVRIEAYISPTVPEEYVQQRLNLISTLRELDTMGGDNVSVDIYPVEALSDAADRAEQQFGIRSRRVASVTRGEIREEEIVLGAVVMSGLEKVVIPFFDRALPVEYELVRSISTVAKEKRLRIGVVKTDVNLIPDGFNAQEPERIIAELRQQYEVVSVDPSEKIAERYDALLVAQPSSLTQPQLDNLTTAIESGQPTAIFEDPLPVGFNVTGTDQPKMPRQNPFGGMPQMPEQKANMERFWQTIGVRLISAPRTSTSMFQPFGSSGDEVAQVIWQDYNPHPKLPFLSEFVFITPDQPGATEAFNSDSVVSSGLQEMLFPFPGAINRVGSTLRYTPLAMTGTRSGIVSVDDFQQRLNAVRRVGGSLPSPTQMETIEKETNLEYVLAAHLRGSAIKSNVGDEWAADEKPSGEGTAEGANKSQINVIFVADVDLMSGQFFDLRAQGNEDLNINLDNVTFLLNVLDVLSGEEGLVELRKRRPVHRTLDAVEAASSDAQRRFDEKMKELQKEFTDAVATAQDAQRTALEREQKRLDKLQQGGDVNLDEQRAAQARLDAVTERETRVLNEKLRKLEEKRDSEMRNQQKIQAREEREIQDGYKWKAVLIPPIFPLAVAFIVFFNRRAREREGVSKTRLK